MGVGGLLQAAAALRVVRAHRAGLAAQWRTLAVAAGAVAVYPLAFYSSMRLAGVAVGTVVSIGSAPVAAALIERVVDRRPLSRRWALGAAAGMLGSWRWRSPAPAMPSPPPARVAVTPYWASRSACWPA